MKLTKARITDFQCIHDSEEFDTGDVTCLVGKNEAGKTAILKALHKINSGFHQEIPFISVNLFLKTMVDFRITWTLSIGEVRNLASGLEVFAFIGMSTYLYNLP